MFCLPRPSSKPDLSPVVVIDISSRAQLSAGCVITFTPPGVGVNSGSGSFREVDQYSSVGRRTGDCGRSRSDGAVAVARPWGATHGLPVSPDGRLAAGWTGVGNDRSATRLGRRGRVRLIVSVLVRCRDDDAVARRGHPVWRPGRSDSGVRATDGAACAGRGVPRGALRRCRRRGGRGCGPSCGFTRLIDISFRRRFRELSELPASHFSRSFRALRKNPFRSAVDGQDDVSRNGCRSSGLATCERSGVTPARHP